MLEQIRSELSELWGRVLALLSAPELADHAGASALRGWLEKVQPALASASLDRAHQLVGWLVVELSELVDVLPAQQAASLRTEEQDAQRLEATLDAAVEPTENISFLEAVSPRDELVKEAPSYERLLAQSASRVDQRLLDLDHVLEIEEVAAEADDEIDGGGEEAAESAPVHAPESSIVYPQAGRASRGVRPARPRRLPPLRSTLEGVAPEPPEPVLLGISAPRAARPGEAFTARFAAYVKGVEAQTKQKLKALADVDVALGYAPASGARWRIGTPVVVRLTGEYFTCTPPNQRFEWNGSEQVLSFQVKTAATAPEGKTQLCFETYIEDVQVSLIIVDVELGARGRPGSQHVRDKPMTTAFASYASRDTARVMDKLSALRSYDRGLDIFVDCLDLTPGEVWKDKLRSEIERRDRFLLFWSVAASESKWVGWEWRRAIELRRAIQPMPLDDPKRAPLPKQLAKLHGYDKFLVVRDASSQRRPSRKRTARDTRG